MPKFKPKPATRRKQPGSGKDAHHKTALMRALAQLAGGPVGVDSPFRLDQFASILTASTWLFSAVYRIANVLASTKIRVLELGTNREAKGKSADALRKLLRRINVEDTAFDFKQAVFVHFSTDGEWMAQKARDGLGRVAQLHVIKPQFTRCNPDPSGRRRVGSFTNWESGQEITIQREEMIYCRQYNTANTYRGAAPTAPLKGELLWDLEAARFNMSLIREGMRIGGILMPKEGYTATPADFEQIKNDLAINNRGARNAGRLIALSAPFDYKPDGITPADMEMIAGRKLIRDMTGSVMGAAPMMMMNYDAASYANSDAQIRQFWDHVGKPMLLQTFGAINEQLVEPDFGEDFEVAPDMAGIDAQIDSEKTRVETTARLLLSGIISLDEARERMGIDPVPDGGGKVHVIQGANVIVKPGEWRNLVTEPETQAGGGPTGSDSSGTGGAAPGVDRPSSADQKPPAERPNRGMNGKSRERFHDASGVLTTLTQDAEMLRLEMMEAEDVSLFLPKGMSVASRRAMLDAIEKMAGGRRADPWSPEVRSAMKRVGEIVLARQERSIDEARKVDRTQLERVPVLDAWKSALDVWTAVTPVLAEAAEAL